MGKAQGNGRGGPPGQQATLGLVLRTAITPPNWRGGAPAILLVHRPEKLVEDLRRAPLELVMAYLSSLAHASPTNQRQNFNELYLGCGTQGEHVFQAPDTPVIDDDHVGTRRKRLLCPYYLIPHCA